MTFSHSAAAVAPTKVAVLPMNLESLPAESAMPSPVIGLLERHLAQCSRLFLNFERCAHVAMEEDLMMIAVAYSQMAKNTQMVFDATVERLSALGQDSDLFSLIADAGVLHAYDMSNFQQAQAEAALDLSQVIAELSDALAQHSGPDAELGSIAILRAALRLHCQHEIFLQELARRAARHSLN